MFISAVNQSTKKEDIDRLQGNLALLSAAFSQ